MKHEPKSNSSGSRTRIEYKWRVLATVIFGLLMFILDTTVVNVAFPTRRQEFGASLAAAQWIMSIYVLVLGISTPLAGFLAGWFAIKRVYRTGLSRFVLGSLGSRQSSQSESGSLQRADGQRRQQ